jgi:hypothetical protein
MGAMDFTMTQLGVPSYLEQFTPQQLAFFSGFPQWATVSWGIAVWFSVLGSYMLLRRQRGAVPVLWISLVAMLATTVHNFILSEVRMSEVVGPGALVFTFIIFIVAVLLLWYSIRQRENRVLV